MSVTNDTPPQQQSVLPQVASGVSDHIDAVLIGVAGEVNFPASPSSLAKKARGRLAASVNPVATLSLKAIENRYEELVAESRLWRYPGRGRSGTLWGHPPREYAARLIPRLVARACRRGKPPSESELLAALRSPLASLSLADRREAINHAVATRTIHLCPPGRRGRICRYGVEPHDWRKDLDDTLAPYFAKLDTAVAKRVKILAQTGVPRQELIAEARRLAGRFAWGGGLPAPTAESGRSPPVMNLQESFQRVAAAMQRIDPRSRSGAPVFVGELRAAVEEAFREPREFDEVILNLERAGRLTLTRCDPATTSHQPGDPQVVADGGHLFVAVSLRHQADGPVGAAVPRVPK
jgi:hypothetical protein